MMANVAFVPSTLGKKIGELVVSACAEKAANPCNVGYIWSVKAAALDATLRQAFDEVTASHPEIKVVAEGESFYTTALGLKAAQDMLQAHPDLSVIVGADQAITGAATAVGPDNAGKIALVGYGGGTIALQGIKSGERYGTVMQMPGTEGRLGTEQLINAIRTGTPAPGMDPLDSLPDGGVVTKANVDTFLPLAEWPG
jgi:ribose transport system substrate-binding protein